MRGNGELFRYRSFGFDFFSGFSGGMPGGMPGGAAQSCVAMDASLNDALLAEAIAKQGGYEEVELKSLWGAVAGALGKKKSHAQMIKQRYEDMLRASVEQEEQEEEEAQDYEVDQILDKRTHQGQLEPARLVAHVQSATVQRPQARPGVRLALAMDRITQVPRQMERSRRQRGRHVMGAEAQPGRRVAGWGRLLRGRLPCCAAADPHALQPTRLSPAHLAHCAGCDEALQEFELRQPKQPRLVEREETAAVGATAPVASATLTTAKPEATCSAVAASAEAADGREYRRVTGVMRPQHGQVGHQGWVVELGEGQARRTPARTPARTAAKPKPCRLLPHPPPTAPRSVCGRRYTSTIQHCGNRRHSCYSTFTRAGYNSHSRTFAGVLAILYK